MPEKSPAPPAPSPGADGAPAGASTGGSPPADASGDRIEGESFERSMDRLEAIIERVESGEAGLEASIREVERGAKLIARCRSILEASEKKIAELDLDALAARAEGKAEGVEGSEPRGEASPPPPPDPEDFE